MNRNLYYYKPYEKSNKSNKNNNYIYNNHKNGNFHTNNFLYMKNQSASYHHHQGNLSHARNDDNYLVREREKEEMHSEKYRKRKRSNNNWTKIPKPIKTTPPTTADQNNVETLSSSSPPKWCKEDAVKAIEIEHAFNHLQSNQYVLRFPDPFIDKSIIQGYSSAIVDVRVQQPITPRYVMVVIMGTPFVICIHVQYRNGRELNADFREKGKSARLNCLNFTNIFNGIF